MVSTSRHMDVSKKRNVVQYEAYVPDKKWKNQVVAVEAEALILVWYNKHQSASRHRASDIYLHLTKQYTGVVWHSSTKVILYKVRTCHHSQLIMIVCRRKAQNRHWGGTPFHGWWIKPPCVSGGTEAARSLPPYCCSCWSFASIKEVVIDVRRWSYYS